MVAKHLAGVLGGSMDNQQVALLLVEALALLHRAKAYVNKYPSIGAQELSKELAEFLAAQGEGVNHAEIQDH